MLKKLKSLFIIEEEVPGQEEKQPAKGSGTATDRPGNTEASFNIPDIKGHVQNKFLDVLFAALESSNQEGFDYLEFKDFLRSLANVPMDDSTRYKSAFATAQTMGATKERILASAGTYIDLLTKEEVKFQDALKAQREKNLTSRQQDIKKLEQTIRSKEDQIQKLQNEIETHRKEIGELENEINTAGTKLAQTASDFEATYQALLGQIQQDVKNIESHL